MKYYIRAEVDLVVDTDYAPGPVTPSEDAIDQLCEKIDDINQVKGGMVTVLQQHLRVMDVK
jgi:hypothetical protein